MNISIDNKAGKTLYTQGKYCAENIVVTPVLEEVSVTPTTAEQTKEPSAGKAGISKVTVTAIQTEEKIVALNMANGDQTIIPDNGKALSSVTVEKPATLIPENIKKDIVIGAVVGTYECGGRDPMSDISIPAYPTFGKIKTSKNTYSILVPVENTSVSSFNITTHSSSSYIAGDTTLNEVTVNNVKYYGSLYGTYYFRLKLNNAITAGKVKVIMYESSSNEIVTNQYNIPSQEFRNYYVAKISFPKNSQDLILGIYFEYD